MDFLTFHRPDVDSEVVLSDVDTILKEKSPDEDEFIVHEIDDLDDTLDENIEDDDPESKEEDDDLDVGNVEEEISSDDE